jgi:hypothetical protein
MKPGKARVPVVKQKCPSCGGEFTVGTASRQKKVQCPLCQGVMILGESEGAVGVELVTEGVTLPKEGERWEALQARVEALELQVESLLVRPRTALGVDPLLMMNREGGGVEEGEGRAGDLGGRRVESGVTGMEIRVWFGDVDGGKVGELVREILEAKGWTVRFLGGARGEGSGLGRLMISVGRGYPVGRVVGLMGLLRGGGLVAGLQIDPEGGGVPTLWI